MPIDGRNAYQATWVRLFAAHQAWLHGEAKKAADVIDGTGPAISLATLPPEAQGSVATQLQPMYLMLGAVGLDCPQAVRRAEQRTAVCNRACRFIMWFPVVRTPRLVRGCMGKHVNGFNRTIRNEGGRPATSGR